MIKNCLNFPAISSHAINCQAFAISFKCSVMLSNCYAWNLSCNWSISCQNDTTDYDNLDKYITKLLLLAILQAHNSTPSHTFLLKKWPKCEKRPKKCCCRVYFVRSLCRVDCNGKGKFKKNQLYLVTQEIFIQIHKVWQELEKFNLF